MTWFTRLLASFALTCGLPAVAAEITIATWNIAWLRAAPLSDADYQRCRGLARTEREALEDRHPMRWECRSAAQYAKIRSVAARIDADIIALQEIESAGALARILPRERYAFHVAEGPWIQRVAFAVRRDRVEVVRFATYRPLGARYAERPRYGADLTVRIAGGKLRLLALHLKSACHGRLLTDESRGPRDDGREPPACLQLADQVKPLEDWIDARVRERVDFIVLGDFNRRFDAAVEREVAARDADGRLQAIWKEIDDDDPPGARLFRLTEGRTQMRGCRTRDPRVPAGERAMFIDHIVVSDRLRVRLVEGSFRQWPLREGRPVPGERSVSDHCPLSVRLRY